MSAPLSPLALSAWGAFLATREQAGAVRREIHRALKTDGRVMLDLGGVRMLSHSFADELFGDLAEELGAEHFRSRVAFLNVSDDIAPILRYVIRSRLSAATPA